MNNSTTCRNCSKPLSGQQTQFCSQSCNSAFYGRLSSQRALDEYLANPNHCEYCGKSILPDGHTQLGDIRKKRFCNRICAGYFHHGGRNGKMASKTYTCRKCGTEFEISRRRPDGGIAKRQLCDNCKIRDDLFTLQSIGELFARRKNWQSARSAIRKNAAEVYFGSGRPTVCAVCGYSNHIQVSHIVAVSEFPKTATVREVNDLANLIALCPNHHWEFDHGILDLSPYLPKGQRQEITD